MNYTNVGGYHFPTTVKSLQTVYPPTSPPTVVSEGITTVSSVHIPQAIPDSTFEIDSGSAAAVWDADEKKLTKIAPDLARKVSKRNLKRGVIMTVLLLTAVLLPIMAFKGLSRQSG
jgi:hypothetical protein